MLVAAVLPVHQAGSGRHEPLLGIQSENVLPQVKDKPPARWELVKQAGQAWLDDYASSMGAALAYYTLFSLAPVLLLVIAIAGAVFGAEAARGEVVAQLRGLIGEEGAVAIEGLLKSASRPAESLVASAIGILTLIVGATTTFAELQSDLDRIWRVPAEAKPSGLWGMIRTRLLSFGLIVSIGFLLLISLVVSAGLAAFGKWYGGFFPGWVLTTQILNQIVSLAFVTVLFALMYRFLPSTRVAWRDVWRGAFATALLFTIGKYLIGLYLGKAGVASGFGAAGSIVVLLVWVYYSAQIFLLGAEFTWVYAHRCGSRAGVEPAAAGATPTKERALGPAAAMPAVTAHDEIVPSGARSALSVPGRRWAPDMAMAALVWVGFGAVRALLHRRDEAQWRVPD